MPIYFYISIYISLYIYTLIYVRHLVVSIIFVNNSVFPVRVYLFEALTGSFLSAYHQAALASLA